MERKKICELQGNFSVGEKVKVKGRITGKRSFGKIIFFDISQAEEMQIVGKLDFCGEKLLSEIKKIEIGDIISVTGETWLSNTGEKSLLIENYTLLSNNNFKDYEGYKKVKRETQYSENYLELSINKEKFNYHKNCSLLISLIRKQLYDRNFLEFYTGILQSNFESGLARPFATYSRALDRNVYLRATTEIKLKRLLAAGYEKIFEMGPLFRNEGIGPRKTPEFLLLDCYWVYKSYKKMMDLFEKIIKRAVKDSFGKYITTQSGRKINIMDTWKRISFKELVKKITGKNSFSIGSREKLRKEMRTEGIKLPKDMPKGRMINKILGKLIFPAITHPTYITEIPAEALPLATTSPEDKNKAQGAILVIDGLFVGDTYNDENNMEKIKEVLKKQAEIANKEVNQEFLDLLRFGLPPSAGFGLGVNQLLLSLKGAEKRDVRETFVHSPLK